MYTITITNEEGDEICEVEVSADRALLAVATLVQSEEAEDEEETTPPPAAKTATKGTRKVRSCSTCGQPGHTIRTCPRNEEPKEPDQEEPLSSEAYDEVIQCKKDGLTSGTVAADLGFNRREVNHAYASHSYENYISLRKSM